MTGDMSHMGLTVHGLFVHNYATTNIIPASACTLAATMSIEMLFKRDLVGYLKCQMVTLSYSIVTELLPT